MGCLNKGLLDVLLSELSQSDMRKAIGNLEKEYSWHREREVQRP